MKYILTIEFWIVVLFISRLENITAPPFDWDTWRQTLTMTIARNLYEIDSNIMFPRIDTGANSEGIMAAEFPIFNYIIFIFYKIFGYHDWYGRLINLTVSSAGLWFFHRIIKRLSTEKIAFYTTLFYGVSVTFKYARKTMPDTFALSLVIIGVYFAFLYLEKCRLRDLTLCFVLTTLGLLSKMPAFCALCFLFVPMLNQSIPLKNRIRLGLTLGVSVGIMSLWYFAWVPYLLETYKNQLYWPDTLSEGWEDLVQLSDQIWLRFTDTVFGMKAGFLIALMGLGALIMAKQKNLLATIAVYSLVFFIFALKTGHVFPTHFYYIIPYTPIVSLAAGYFIAELTVPTLLKGVIAFLLLNVSNNYQRFDMFPAKGLEHLLELEGIMDKYVRKDEKIMTNGGAFNPTNHYFAHRRGWVENDDVLTKKDWMPAYKEKGLVYIVIDKHFHPDTLTYTRIFDNPDFTIYKP